MKQVLLSLVLSLVVMAASAQSEKYTKAMQERIAAMDTTRDVQGLAGLAAAFERIAEAEKSQWHPFYYAALALVNSGYSMTGGNLNGGLESKLDPIADKAEALISKAESLSPSNSEIYIVKKMIATLRMMANPPARYMQYGPMAQQALETARKLNPANPRVYLLEGQDQFYTPEQYGGSKEAAKKLLNEALVKFAAFQPATPLDPTWGRLITEYYLGMIK